LKSIDDLEVAGTRVFVRSDLNVPLDGASITDDGRIRASVPTIRLLAKRGARVVVAAHLGRPGGQERVELSLRPVAVRLAQVLDQEVGFAANSHSEDARRVVAALADGEIALLENVRFDPRETSKIAAERLELAHEYAALADLFVSDGFGVVHRKQASVYDIAGLLPHAPGLLVQKEIEVLRRLTLDPIRPYVVVLGGAKVSDKLAVIEHLMERVDRLLIGGGMAYTFLAAQGKPVGRSLLEPDQVSTVASLLEQAQRRGVEVVLPTDIVVAARFAADAEPSIVDSSAIPDDQMGLDIGPTSQALFASRLADARTVFWNGPMGVFEFPAFAGGTRAVAQALTSVEGLTVVGGGDSAAAVRTLGFEDSDFGHISTGGGASLEYLEGKTLPGLAVLED
jgi:phosphoglycerate kinase